jgi:hypothetical protein
MGRKGFNSRIGGFLTLLVIVAVFSCAAMLIWNVLMPDIFGLPTLNIWQTLGLLLLCRIFFGSVGPKHFGHWAGHHGLAHGNALRERWMSMSDEERKAFIEKEKDFRHFFHRDFHHHHPFGEDATTGNKKDNGAEKNG